MVAIHMQHAIFQIFSDCVGVVKSVFIAQRDLNTHSSLNRPRKGSLNLVSLILAMGFTSEKFIENLLDLETGNQTTGELILLRLVVMICRLVMTTLLFLARVGL